MRACKIVLRFLMVAAAAAVLSGCAVYSSAEPEEISRAHFSSDEPASVTLISMVKASSDRSAHSALLINGSEQILYDPAGTFQHPDLPRSGDIHYGMTPRFVDYYERYHARFSHYAQSQKIMVSRSTADQIIANAKAEGRTPKLFCSVSTASILKPVAPFNDVTTSFLPEALRKDFERIPGVETSYVYESDVGQNKVWEQPKAAPSGQAAARGNRR
jgi:hypothetical protein